MKYLQNEWSLFSHCLFHVENKNLFFWLADGNNDEEELKNKFSATGMRN
jgi:hypothetical protein